MIRAALPTRPFEIGELVERYLEVARLLPARND